MASDRNTSIRSSQILKHTIQLDDLSPDALVWQDPVEDKDLTTPPGSPSEGVRYLIIFGGSGTDWVGQDNKVTQYINGSWIFYTPIEGWFIWINDENKLYRFDGTSWDEFAGTGGISDIVEDTTPQLGGDLDLNGYNIDFPSVANISDVKDEDNMVSDSATMLATQQSIKKYVDNNTGIDDFTIKRENNELKLADRIELNTMLNAFRIAINGSLSQFGMVDGITDEYEDETGIDTVNSLNEDYDSVNDLYEPTIVAGLELDYMEYATDGAAQAAYVSSDAYDKSNDKLLLHLNNNVTDSGATEHIVTNNGMSFDAGTKKFGSHAGYFNSAESDYLSIPDHADWDIGTNFTIDFWVKHAVGEPGVYEMYATQPEDVFNKWIFARTGSEELIFGLWENDVALIRAETAVDVLTDTDWHHIAFCKVGDVCGLYLDGNQVAYDSGLSVVAFAADLYIGQSGSSTQYLNGHMDEIRIQHTNVFSASPNVGKTNTIVVPTSEYGISNLQSYSEDTIINQGSYSLKAIAVITDSLNDTLTKSGLSIDLSDKDELKLYCYASRTGTNLQIQIHDSGGTTSTKDIVISSATTWTEITWDISGISNANKDDIDSIIIKIINADSANTFYVDNFRVDGETNNMTLISNSFTAEVAPDDARIVLFEEDVDSITENTDIKAYISRDGGSTYAQVTLTDEGDYQSGKRILTGVVDLTQSGVGSGTNIEYKIETLNNKSLKLHGCGLHWD